MKFIKTASLMASIAFSSSLLAVELSNSDNNQLLINGQEAAIQLSVYDNNDTPLKGYKLLSFEGDGEGIGLLTLDSGASMVVSLTGQGVLGGSYVDIDTVSVCDAEGDSIGSGANTWQLLKTSHILMKNEDSYEVYTSNKVEGVDCPTLSLDSTGNITEHPSKGEKVSTTVLTLDTDATAEFNVWLNELVLPIYAQ
nr:hypothetical protein [uncultured Vibrio sp.]